MAVLNGSFHSGDEKDALIPGKIKKIPVEGPDIVIGDSQDFKALISRLRINSCAV